MQGTSSQTSQMMPFLVRMQSNASQEPLESLMWRQGCGNFFASPMQPMQNMQNARAPIRLFTLVHCEVQFIQVPAAMQLPAGMQFMPPGLALESLLVALIH